MKTKSACVSIGILLVAASVTAHAAQFGDFEYESSGTAITLTGYTGPGGDVLIPDTIAGLPVTSIGEHAFCDCSGLTTVRIGNSLRSIGGGAFALCTSLRSIEIPNNVTTIGWSAFWGCTSLFGVALGSGVK